LWEWSGSWYPGSEGSFRVLRGGYSGNDANMCGFAFRNSSMPGPRTYTYANGFRLALSSAP
jgi:formylglycine-generating enzyme required for sulfatase activity